MMVAQNEKAIRFRALHEGPGAFIIPNPWDVGSARILAGLGFRALATSSAASAAAIGRRDGRLTRDEALVGIKGKSFSVSELVAAGVRRISLATSLYRAAMTGLLDAARQVRDMGEFGFLDRSVTTPELNELMGV